MSTHRQAKALWQATSLLPLALAVSTAFADQRVLSSTALSGPSANTSAPTLSAPVPNNRALQSTPPARSAVERVQSETILVGQSITYTPPQRVRDGSRLDPPRRTAKVLVEVDIPAASAADIAPNEMSVSADTFRSTSRPLRPLSITTIGESMAAESTVTQTAEPQAPARFVAPRRTETSTPDSVTTPVPPAEVIIAETSPAPSAAPASEASFAIERKPQSTTVSETVIGRVTSEAVVIQDATETSDARVARAKASPSVTRPEPRIARSEDTVTPPLESDTSPQTPTQNALSDARVPVQPDQPRAELTPEAAVAIREPNETREPEQTGEPTSNIEPTQEPLEVTVVLPPEPPTLPDTPAVQIETPAKRPEESEAPELTERTVPRGGDEPERRDTVDDPFMISQMNPNRRLRETDVPLFDESMPVIDDEIARLQLRQWQDMIRAAVDTNPATRVALFTERAAEAGVGEQSAALYPQVSLGVSGAVERSVRDGERVPSLAGMEADNRFQVSPELTIRQLVFDGGATRSRVNAAEGQRTVANKQRQATEQNVAIQAADTLIALAKTQEQLQIAEEHLTEIERVRDMIRERVNAGRDAPSELISINARVFEARNRIREIQTEQAAATAEFREVFAAPPVILAFPDVFAPIPMNPRTGFDMAMAFNPEIQASQAAIDVARAEFDASKGDGLPRIEVEASANGFDTFNRGNDYYDSSIGLRMTTDLFDGGRQEAAVQRALNNLESARFRHDQTINAVERIVNAAYSERVNLIPRFKASQAKRDQEIASREAYVEQWLAGRRPLNDLLAAQDRVFQNSLEAIELKSELHRQHFFILSLIGDLTQPVQ